MSEHKAEVVEVSFSKHPNADSLSTTPVWGYSYVGKTSEWQGVDKAVWIPPDTVVDVRRPEFSFLADRAKADGTHRVKAVRLRGIVSYGLMIPAPSDAQVGEDHWDRLGLVHYEPPLAHEKQGGGALFGGCEDEGGPSVVAPKYDLENLLRHHRLLEPGEPVWVSEKLDGANARFLFHDGRMHAGSRTAWKKPFPSYDHVTLESLLARGVSQERATEVLDRLHSRPARKNLWWEVLERTEALEKFCRDNPGVVVYGEVYGSVNCIKYGLPDVNRFAGFDLLENGGWACPQAAIDRADAAGLPWAPVLSCAAPFDLELVKTLAEGPTLARDAKEGVIREGVVVAAGESRVGPRNERMKFKVVNPTFLERYR